MPRRAADTVPRQQSADRRRRVPDTGMWARGNGPKPLLLPSDRRPLPQFIYRIFPTFPAMRPHEKPRSESSVQEVRIGRHRDKLEEIRESLRAFEQGGEQEQNSKPQEKPAPTSTEQTTPKKVNNDVMELSQQLQQQKMYNSSQNERTTMRAQHQNLINSFSPPHFRPPPPSYDAKPAYRGPTPAAPDNVRTHLHIKTSPYVGRPDFAANPVIFPTAGRTHISIEPYNKMMENKESRMTRHESWQTKAQQPVYHTTLSSNNAVPSTSIVNINISPSHRANLGMQDLAGSSRSVLIGLPNRRTDADFTRVYMNYEDELMPQPYSDVSPSTSKIQDEAWHGPPHPSTLFMPPQNLDITLQTNFKPVPNGNVARMSNGMSSPSTKRSTSPLPLEVRERLQTNKFETSLQSCKPNMFCFYMEQHVERLLQQHREREKRVQQLEKEMNAADLPLMMRQKMLELLQQKESRYTRLRRQKMGKEMFTVIQHIGVGAFGKVSLVRKKDTGKVYAMKSLEKADVIMKQQASHVKAERDILAEADSPWIVRLFFSFQDHRCLYFIMEYVPGGDMMQLLINKGIFEESLARFYIAELTCAIEYVHSVGFIHRDIKPDNILIDKNGHIKLTDFGLCTGLRWTHDRRYYGTENEHQRADSFSLPAEIAATEESIKVLNIRHQKKRNCAHSVVGTGNYMAPEVISRTGHTQLCDWWSAGVILYEMVFGRPPFMSMRDDPRETQDKILNWRIYLDVSASAGGGRLSADCISIIKEFICDASNRLGSKGASQIKKHQWFKDINFATLRQSRAEFIPRVEHAEDTSNFDTIHISDKAETLNTRAPNNPAFYEFTFRHFFDTDGMGCPSLRPSARRPSLKPLLENPQPGSEELLHVQL
ncbi:unnamed protein product [Caenorhabditis auriculariae]|uniref:non-specific serine/threonine protein kinase n=1 Tax=Caenorhabditis auriculariae TaxID=2777116 RepID=A0A8S1GQE2_9PELO|nr:unnamed protein product [Caenorhabditis auriculariae]